MFRFSNGQVADYAVVSIYSDDLAKVYMCDDGTMYAEELPNRHQYAWGYDLLVKPFKEPGNSDSVKQWVSRKFIVTKDRYRRSEMFPSWCTGSFVDELYIADTLISGGYLWRWVGLG